ncbi:DUF6228 family protein [Nocardia sp. NPDC023988]|uniref:DUF6228 family protein n=1 Tax=unclassified Nocardia TaxID=2637762 RepID=UPI0033CD24A8
MDCDCNQNPDWGRSVCLGEPGHGTWVRLWNRVDPWGDNSARVCVQVGGPGMAAMLHQVTVSLMGDRDLVSFFQSLSDDFAGWGGVRVWESIDRDLRIDAVFASRGRVGLTWTVRPWRHDDGNWTASTTVVLEAGEQMLRLAADLDAEIGNLS